MKHKSDCKRVFNRYDATCPRCVELIAGAKPREGWGDRQRENDRRTLEAIRKHNFTECARVNGVCTHFEW
jgi:hypothetical protein